MLNIILFIKGNLTVYRDNCINQHNISLEEITNHHEDDKTTDGTGEDDRGRRHAGRLRRETALPDQRNRRMVPEILRGGVQAAAHTRHRQQLDREGRQAARHGPRHAGRSATCTSHRFGGQQQDRRDGLFRLPDGDSVSKRPTDGAVSRHAWNCRMIIRKTLHCTKGVYIMIVV